MAVGDAIAAFMGTAATTRQPSAGVEEQISAIAKPDRNDRIGMYDGTFTLSILENAAVTVETRLATGIRFGGDYNIAVMSTNAMYISKPGASDRVIIFGVQTNV